jgi:hypothetical protein
MFRRLNSAAVTKGYREADALASFASDDGAEALAAAKRISVAKGFRYGVQCMIGKFALVPSIRGRVVDFC